MIYFESIQHLLFSNSTGHLLTFIYLPLGYIPIYTAFNVQQEEATTTHAIPSQSRVSCGSVPSRFRVLGLLLALLPQFADLCLEISGYLYINNQLNHNLLSNHLLPNDSFLLFFLSLFQIDQVFNLIIIQFNMIYNLIINSINLRRIRTIINLNLI